MKKIILSIVALIAILWIAMFATDAKVLVREKSVELEVDNTFDCFDPDRKPVSKYVCRTGWNCTYFNGRRLIEKHFKVHYDACPNLL